jgi:hypothetical protein
VRAKVARAASPIKHFRDHLSPLVAQASSPLFRGIGGRGGKIEEIGG